MAVGGKGPGADFKFSPKVDRGGRPAWKDSIETSGEKMWILLIRSTIFQFV